MQFIGSREFLELSVVLLERGIHGRVLGMAEDDCVTLVTKIVLQGDADNLSEDLCRFGWAIEDAFRTAGLHDCVLSVGDHLVVRPDRMSIYASEK